MRATPLILLLVPSILIVTQQSNADTLSFQEGDGGAYSSTAATFITYEGATVWGSHFILEVLTHDEQTLIRFPDIIGGNPGQIPPGSTIVSATLSLTKYIAVFETAASNIHKMLVPWDENAGVPLPGPLWGPFLGQLPDVELGEITSGDVTAPVQDWADGEANWGIMLRLETPQMPEEGFHRCQYFSDDAAELVRRPKLTVEFTPPVVAVESTTWGRVKTLYR